MRLLYAPAGGGSLSLYLDHAQLPVFTSALDLHATALDDDGRALAGFTAASGGPGREVAVELHDWHLAAAHVAAFQRPRTS